MEQLFSKVLLLQMKSTEREDRRCYIKITIQLCTVTSPLHRKELKVRLTDDDDPFFLFNLSLGEEDFQSLKIQQGLLVDFTDFPQKFVDLLELSLQEQNNDMPKFLIRLETHSSCGGSSVATLSVVETNPFKHLTHLSLKLLPGMDADVKKYLADCLKNLKDEKSSLESRLAHTEADLSQRLRQTQEALSARTSELDSLKTEWSSRTRSLTAQHSHEVLNARERAAEIQNDNQNRFDREKREMDESYQIKIQQLEERLAQQDTSNKELVDRKYRAESNIRELKAKLSGLEEDYHRACQELKAIRKDNNNLDTGCHEREKTISQLRTRVAVLDQEVRDKDLLIDKTNKLLEAATEHKVKVEETCSQSQVRINKLESTLKNTSQEVHKGNDIIKKLQGELKTYMAKLKLKNTVTTKQEKILGEKTQELIKCQEELRDVTFKFNQKENENKGLSESFENVKQKLEQSRELLKTNESVINWLNKQVNEVQLTRNPGTFDVPYPGGAAASFRPTFNPTQPLSTSVISTIPGNHTDSRFSHHSLASRPNSSQPQIHYNPQAARKPNLMAHQRLSSPGITVIPEELSSTPITSAPSVVTARPSNNNEPVLDAKFLQPTTNRNNIISVRGPAQHSTPASHVAPTAYRPVAKVSQATTRPSVQQASRPGSTPPLMSAYFPGQHQQASV